MLCKGGLLRGPQGWMFFCKSEISTLKCILRDNTTLRHFTRQRRVVPLFYWNRWYRKENELINESDVCKVVELIGVVYKVSKPAGFGFSGYNDYVAACSLLLKSI